MYRKGKQQYSHSHFYLYDLTPHTLSIAAKWLRFPLLTK